MKTTETMTDFKSVWGSIHVHSEYYLPLLEDSVNVYYTENDTFCTEAFKNLIQVQSHPR